MSNFHEFSATTIDGETQSLGDYAGKVALVVNLASECGLTPQYKALQALHAELKDKDFVVLGFPCNQFGKQEPGTDSEVKAFATEKFGVSFPLYSKIDVNGPDAAPVYAWLREQPTQPEGPGDIAWNFGKFLIGKDGAVLARFSPKTAPDAPEVRAVIEKAL